MTMSASELAISNDLQKKCATDCVDATTLVTNLCDNSAQAAFVACGGVIGAAGVLMALMSTKETVTELPGTDMHDFAFFAMMFAWASGVKDDRVGNLRHMLPMLVGHWERITGKTFDVDWLNRPLASIVTEAREQAA